MSNYPARRRLIVTATDIDDLYGATVAPAVGDTVCIVECTDHRPVPAGWHRGRRRWKEVTTAPRTNSSREIRWEGWLGETNNIDRHAEGAYRLVSITQQDPYAGTYEVSVARIA